jgi:acetyl esterase/lipase
MKPNKTPMDNVHHPLSAQDAKAIQLIREQNAPFKGALIGPLARAAYDPIFENIAAADGVQYVPDQVAGIQGVWCRPRKARAGAAILYLHGGAYVLGSAHAYRHFAGQFAARTQVSAFVADYRLAPEHPFPAAMEDAQAVYRGLLAAGYQQIIVVGDSAGGGLSLALLSQLQLQRQVQGAAALAAPVAAVLMSPWTDVALTGASLESKAAEDPMLTRDMIAANAALFLGSAQATDPRASPLYAQLLGLPPLQIHVGTSEVLLDDSVRYARRAQEAGVDATLHVWQDMPHVFPATIGILEAADQAMALMADFIAARLKAGPGV